MLFKSEKLCSSTSADFLKKFLARAFILTTAVSPVLVSASMTISAIQRSNYSNVLNNIQNSNYYYPAYVGTPTTGNFNYLTQVGTLFSYQGLGYDWVDTSAEPNDADGINQDPSLILFLINSSNTTFAGSPIIVATTPPNGTIGGAQLIPIATVGQNGNSSYCNNGGNCFGNGISGANNNYYYAANYTAGAPEYIGISVHSLCKSFFANGGNQAAGCDTFFFSSETGATAQPTTELSLTFSIYDQTDITALPTPLGSPTTAPQDTLTAVNITLENISGINAPVANTTGTQPQPSPTPSANCNLSEGVYTPLDGGMQIQTGNFTIIGPLPTPQQLVVVGTVLASPLPAEPLTNTNSNALVADYTQASVLQPVTAANPNAFGFQNSSSTTYDYAVGFLTVDPAGYVFDGGGCTLPGYFNTSHVQGFLSGSKCFIASGAFREESAPLETLRDFRDEFLERFGVGRSFVHWYYGWSPHAAEWLIDHPVFRFPVLLALVPLQLLAWTVLHPFLLLILALAASSILLSAIIFRISSKKFKRETA